MCAYLSSGGGAGFPLCQAMTEKNEQQIFSKPDVCRVSSYNKCYTKMCVLFVGLSHAGNSDGYIRTGTELLQCTFMMAL